MPSLNVGGAWQLATGKHITIGIISDGVKRDHQDLKVDESACHDFNPDMPQSRNSIGTRLAGIAASSANEICGIGVAFDAKIADIRLLDDQTKTDTWAEALVQNLDTIDVYLSGSRKSTENRAKQKLDKLPHDIETAFQKGVTQGRSGRGAIYVWDTSKLGSDNSCAYDSIVNSVYTIPIVGVTKDGNKLNSGTACSAVMATGYASDWGSVADDQIVTISSRSTTSCDADFGDASAASAMMAGVAALVLEANPLLRWRDVQHLITLTSNPDGYLKPNDFVFNGASLRVSNNFGFGLIDAAQMVAMAKQWQPVSQKKTCTIDSPLTTGPEQSPKRLIMFLRSTMCTISFLEHVEIHVAFQYSNKRGSVKLTLVSPSNTRSLILPGRLADNHRADLDWTVLSVQFWGETPHGTWQLIIDEAESSGFAKGAVSNYKWSLTFHGLTVHPNISTNIATLRPNIHGNFVEEEPTSINMLPWWLILLVGAAFLSFLLAVAAITWNVYQSQKHKFGREGSDKYTAVDKDTEVTATGSEQVTTTKA